MDMFPLLTDEEVQKCLDEFQMDRSIWDPQPLPAVEAAVALDQQATAAVQMVQTAPYLPTPPAVLYPSPPLPQAPRPRHAVLPGAVPPRPILLPPASPPASPAPLPPPPPPAPPAAPVTITGLEKNGPSDMTSWAEFEALVTGTVDPETQKKRSMARRARYLKGRESKSGGRRGGGSGSGGVTKG